MRYPYERFLVFLISRKADVNEILERLELPNVGDMGLADRKEKIRCSAPPALLRYLKQGRDDTALVFRDGILRWAESEGLLGLWERQKEFGRRIVPALETAANAFLNPRARTVLGAMLLAGAPTKEVSEVMSQQFSLEVTSETLEHFSFIFWDVKGMGRTEWDEFIPLLETDQRVVLTLGVTGAGTDDIRYAIGAGTPSKPKDVLRDILTHAHHQFKKAMLTPHPASYDALKWADLATKVVSSMRSGIGSFDDDGPTEHQVAESLFSVTMESPRIISMDDLEGTIAQNKTALDRAMEDLAAKSK